MKVYDFINADLSALALALKPFIIETPVDPAVPPPVPEGMTEVRPTGPRGAGIIRLWPTPRPDLGENAWGYVKRCSGMVNPTTGQPYFPAGLLGAFRDAENIGNFAEIADRFLYPEQYWDQAELDRKKRIGDDQAGTIGLYVGTGTIPVGEVELADAQFLNWLSHYSPRYKDCWTDLLSGSWEAIKYKQSQAYNSGVAFDPWAYFGRFQQVVRDFYKV